jgi:hypothetical protein
MLLLSIETQLEDDAINDEWGLGNTSLFVILFESIQLNNILIVDRYPLLDFWKRSSY